jgi:phage terminase large subunit
MSLINNKLKFKFPYWFKPFFEKSRYKILYGGRGGAKSWVIADYLLFLAMTKKGTILCTRAIQKTLTDSVLSLLKDRIVSLGIASSFKVLSTGITCKVTGTNFIFAGLNQNIDGLKSIHDIICCWVEEGAYVSKASWEVLTPSIRGKGSEIIVTFNPCNARDVIYHNYILNDQINNVLTAEVSYRGNPYYSQEIHDERMIALNTLDTDTYQHVWEGKLLEHSHAQIFKDKWQVIAKEDFVEPEDTHPYYGLDFGFSQDPTAGIRCFVNDADNKLYITHEAVKIGLEIDHTMAFLEKHLPDVGNYTIYADNARPESISFLKRQGLSIKAVEKGKGSVEDGIEYIKSFDGVVIHERCLETINEFTHYSYKVDERSGDITNKIVDSNNHLVDALRYALERSMKKGKSPTLKQLDTFDKSMNDYYEEKKLKNLFGY